jgi:hypothetical protein
VRGESGKARIIHSGALAGMMHRGFLVSWPRAGCKGTPKMAVYMCTQAAIGDRAKTLKDKSYSQQTQSVKRPSRDPGSAHGNAAHALCLP